MDPSDAAIDQLAAQVGTGKVLRGVAGLETYSTPQNGPSGQAAFVVVPGTPEEVSTVASWAFRNRANVVLQGANTGLVRASTPDQSGSQGVMSLSGLDRIMDVSVDDLTADVEAGVLLDDLNDELAHLDLYFPVELGSNPSIGGLIATNAGGARTIRHGTAGSRVVALEAVLADEKGSRIGSLAAVEKSNSTLRSERLIVGSYGALGVAVRARIRLARVPRAVGTALLALDSFDAALACLSHFKRSYGSKLLAFEVISGATLEMALRNVLGLRPPFRAVDRPCYVLVEVGGSGEPFEIEEGLAQSLDRLATESPQAMDDAIIGSPSELWGLRHSLSTGVRREGLTTRFDVSVPVASLPGLHSSIEDLVARDRRRPVLSEFGHWAAGGTHIQLVYPLGESLDNESSIRTAVYDIVVKEFQGSFSAEHGLGPANAEFYRRYVPAEEQLLESRVKRAFDPRMVWGSTPLSVRSTLQEGCD